MVKDATFALKILSGTLKLRNAKPVKEERFWWEILVNVPKTSSGMAITVFTAMYPSILTLSKKSVFSAQENRFSIPIRISASIVLLKTPTSMESSVQHALQAHSLMKQTKIARLVQPPKCTTHYQNSANVLMELFGMETPASCVYTLNTSIFRQKFARTVPMVRSMTWFKRSVLVVQRRVPSTEITSATNALIITITMSLLILVHLAPINRFLTLLLESAEAAFKARSTTLSRKNV